MVKYSFLEDMPRIETEKKRRTCLSGLASNCKGYVVNYSFNRICDRCSIIIDRQTRGTMDSLKISSLTGENKGSRS